MIYLKEPKLLCFYNILFKFYIAFSSADFLTVDPVTTNAELF